MRPEKQSVTLPSTWVETEKLSESGCRGFGTGQTDRQTGNGTEVSSFFSFWRAELSVMVIVIYRGSRADAEIFPVLFGAVSV